VDARQAFQVLLHARTRDRIGSLAGIQIEHAEFLRPEVARFVQMHQQGAEELAAAADQRRGLHGAKARERGQLSIWRIGCVRIYVLDDDAFAVAQETRAGRFIADRHGPQGSDEFRREAALCHDFERSAFGIVELDIAEIAIHEQDGCIQDFIQRRDQVRRNRHPRGRIAREGRIQRGNWFRWRSGHSLILT
jgi:hypothetical protein